MGEALVLSSSVLLALSTVFAHYLTKGLDPLVIVFYSFLLSFIFFNFTGLRNKSIISLIKNNWKWVIFVNITTALDWLLIFIALKYISAALINCFVFGLAPIATLLLTYKNYPSRKAFVKDLVICCLISLLLICLSIVYYQNNNGISNLSATNILWGILFSSISGLATGATIYGCKKLQIVGFSTNSVMRSRFIAIIIMAILLLKFNQASLALDIGTSTDIVLLTFIFVIIPTFLLQKGIERTLPIMTTIITSLIPVLTYLFQFLEPDFIFDLKEIMIITVLSCVVIISTIHKKLLK